MDYQTAVQINMPFVTVNILVNAFFIFCMICPLHGERIKQPLKLLLGSMICYTVAYQISIMVPLLCKPTTNNVNRILASYVVSVCILTPSMTSSVWLNFFYFIQIVPAQRALFIWIKRNIKPIIYCIWLLERGLNLFEFTIMFLEFFPDGFKFSNNFTTDYDINLSEKDYIKLLRDRYTPLASLAKFYFFFFLPVMVISSGSTVVYLCKHMRHMAANGQLFPCARFSGQVRVTVTGILQGVLYASCCVWTLCIFLSQQILDSLFDPYIIFTIINMYMTGTTFNLGVGQAVFRQRAADLWIRATQWCKVPKVQQSERGG